MKFLKTALKDTARAATLFAILFLGYNNRDTLKETVLDILDYITSWKTGRKFYKMARGWALLCKKMAGWSLMLTMVGTVASAIVGYCQQDGPSRLFGNVDPRSIFGLTFAVGAVMTMLVMVTAKIAQGIAQKALEAGELAVDTAWRLLPETLFGRPSGRLVTEPIGNELEKMTNSVLSASLGYLTVLGIIQLSGMVNHPDSLIAFIPLGPMAMIWTLAYSEKPVIIKVASALVIVVGLVMTVGGSTWKEIKTTDAYQDLTGVKQDAIGRIVMGKEKPGDRKILGANAFDDLIEARTIARKKGATACEKQNAVALDKRAKSAALDGKTEIVTLVDCAAVAKAQADAATKKAAETQKQVQAQTQRQAAAGRVMNTGKLSPSDRAILDGVAVHAQRYFSLNQKAGKTECEQGQMQELYAAISAYVKSGQSAPAQVRSCTAVANTQRKSGTGTGSAISLREAVEKAKQMTLKQHNLL